MITCQICKLEFKSIISPSHLKKHGVLPIDYKNMYGSDSLSTDEYRSRKAQHFSSINSGRPSWNKDKKIVATEKQKQAYVIREQKYNSGEMQRRDYNPLTQEVKSKISVSIKEYAKDNHEELSERFKKAQVTKIQKGIQTMPSFKGGKHSLENVQLFSEMLNKHRQIRIESSHKDILEKIQKVNLQLINDIGNTQLQLVCDVCQTQFNFTKQYFHDCKFHEELCPTCFPRAILTSKAQTEIYEHVKSIYADAILNYKTVHGDIDIYIPSKNMGIEYNGLYWHSVEVLTYNDKSKIKDFDKYNKLKNDGIHLICIFEDEWLNKKEIVLSRLENMFGNSVKIGARQCEIRELDISTARKFFEDNHIQGYGNSQIKYGLFHNDQLVCAMTFSQSNVARKSKDWEIVRFCNKIGTSVVGGAGKLFKNFITEIAPEKVISYADSRWSSGNLYGNLGFSFVRQTVPNYWYFKPNELKRIHRFTLRKRSDEPKGTTEKDLRFSEGYYHIYDYGSSKWIWITPTVPH